MKLSLAPIQGMTTSDYRILYHKHFGHIDQYYAPFIATTEVSRFSPKLLKDLIPKSADLLPILVPQLLGNNGRDFKTTAAMIAQMGYQEINWNIGCPYPMVTKKKKGSGLLPYPQLIKDFLTEVFQDNPYQLSVKMRLGMDHFQEGIDVLNVLNEFSVKEVILHPRTGSMRYTGYVDLEAFEILSQHSKHPLVYNGDIFTLEDFQKVHMKFKAVHHFMLGRGALYDPFLPAAIKGIAISTEEKTNTIRSFHQQLFDQTKERLSGDKHLLDRMKEFWSYTGFHMDLTGHYMKKIRKSHTSDDYLLQVEQLFSHCSWQNNIPSEAVHKIWN